MQTEFLGCKMRSVSYCTFSSNFPLKSNVNSDAFIIFVKFAPEDLQINVCFEPAKILSSMNILVILNKSAKDLVMLYHQ